ncbi:CehA/McbA family metallohydrolase [Janthinobacterium fluminis]|uniref:CehA/McbA family metallohydrolase n=1 Tax=Janthinobacterium fluminis TaxID=2987524 RepID=A0ABT5JUM4_9BURK|nr:CehA/McbA family metallohydrolase [Janthinobacterium fluminis]MDC8756422.1 CehA/McbA family metallohydrolase [Janthinobacterium fluminis]
MGTIAACMLLGMLAAAATTGATAQAPFEHREFDATLDAPYRAAPAQGRSPGRAFTLHFSYPAALREQAVTWRLELLAPSGQPVQQWFGVARLFERAVTLRIPWGAGKDAAALPDGNYQLRLRALAQERRAGMAAPLAPRRAAAGDPGLAAAARTLAEGQAGLIEQRWDILVGNPAPPAMPAFRALPARAAPPAAAPAPDALPYTVYYGNLHSQTRHSDGGGDVAHCSGAQAPQSGAFGPADAYAFARAHGLDILFTSEHNHMYDGSDGTNGDADAAAAKALYHAGLDIAAEFNAAHPDFLAIYGMEWGVINNGGHLNIFNSEELLGWEVNNRNELLADTLTPKNDYASLFALMRQRGWIGQFNHPALNGQFRVGGVPFGYSADGDAAMALCEVMNSSAFSTNMTETESRRSNYELACNKALEAGYHLAFSSDQDNHCANWGASYSNRTGILIPNGVPLSQASVLDALKARRVFATMDKHAQLVLSANGHLMGERFNNSGPLRLLVNYASLAGGRVATVAIYEGVPGRNGTVTQLASVADTTITPANGEHFYYAKVTQDDGKVLWSAPVWVSQGACP